MHQFSVASYLASSVAAAIAMQWRLTAAVVERHQQRSRPGQPASCEVNFACMRNDFSHSHMIISSITVQRFILPHNSWGRSPNTYVGGTRPFPVVEGAAHARLVRVLVVKSLVAWAISSSYRTIADYSLCWRWYSSDASHHFLQFTHCCMATGQLYTQPLLAYYHRKIF